MDAVDERDDQDQPGPARAALELAQPEQDAALVLLEHADRGCQQDQHDGGGDQDNEASHLGTLLCTDHRTGPAHSHPLSTAVAVRESRTARVSRRQWHERRRARSCDRGPRSPDPRRPTGGEAYDRVVSAGRGELAGFARAAFEHAGQRYDLYRAGSGPGVVVIHEMPGIHPGVTALGRRLVDAGYSVYLPSLFGRPGEPLSAGSTARSIARVCVAREFAILADRTSPVTTWLRALARHGPRECGGRGVGAVGMCFTGGFALAMAVEPAVLAPVLSQPALPMPISARKRAALGLDDADLARVRDAPAAGSACSDCGSPPTRAVPAHASRRCAASSAPSFEGIEIDSSPGNPDGIPSRAHAVLTVDLVDEPGHPTRAALERVMAFLDERLRPPTAL